MTRTAALVPPSLFLASALSIAGAQVDAPIAARGGTPPVSVAVEPCGRQAVLLPGARYVAVRVDESGDRVGQDLTGTRPTAARASSACEGPAQAPARR